MLLLAILCAALCIAWWVNERYRAWLIKQAVAKETCEREGHDLERIFAFNDARFPVDNCRRCPYQTPVIIPCPHCGKELGNGTSRS